ncbi:MAG: quinone-dependent dihydroorotate dehydrogenase [Rhodoferax sp.]|nr:quinone-dependent dihydroorotate dehydrogenase [Rhodoferax sp.]
MALIPYGLIRPLLFGMDPETSHDLILSTLATTQGTALACSYRNPRVEDPVSVAGLRFANRVGLAAGLDKNARCIDGLAALGFGCIEVGTVTPLPQDGNPKPRMFRLPKAGALINRLGFNNHGLDAFVRNVQTSALRQAEHPAVLLGLNIGKNAATPIEDANSDYLRCLDGVYPFADYITVNISSPNTHHLRQLQADAALDALLGAIAERRELLAQRHGQRKPVFLKIAPDLDAAHIEAIAATLQRYGCDSSGTATHAWGVIATNTTLSRSAVQGLPHANETGGLSGAPVLAVSNKVIRQLRQALGSSFPIIGVGGILSAADAVSKIRAGAALVQIYTGLIYHGPALVTQCARAIQGMRG